MAKIYIDEGHGGSDPGACNGAIRESHINLFIGLNLKYLLEQAGHQIMLARGDDSYVSLQARVLASNSWGSDRFISIHANASENKTVKGFEAWYYKQDAWARRTQVALSEAMVGHTDRGIKRCSGYGGQNPSSDGGPLYVLIHTSCPAILVESEFISNDDMCEWLCESANRKLVAEAIFKSIIP